MAPRLRHSVMTITSTDASRVPIVAAEKGCKAAVNAVPRSFLMWRARLPQILVGQERIIVAPQQETYELACAYAAQQRDFGNIQGQIVRVLGDAYLAFDLKQTDFRPVR
jgi:hypothetical protein